MFAYLVVINTLAHWFLPCCSLENSIACITEQIEVISEAWQQNEVEQTQKDRYWDVQIQNEARNNK